MTNLLEEIGGRATVETATRGLFQRVRFDAGLAPFFDGVSTHRLESHLTEYLCALLGGGDGYRGRDISTVHQRMQVADEQFELFMAHLSESFGAAGVRPGSVDEIMARLAPARALIVGDVAARVA